MIPIATVRDCEVCGGKGVVAATDLTVPAAERSRQIETCPRCAGTGALIVKENRP